MLKKTSMLTILLFLTAAAAITFVANPSFADTDADACKCADSGSCTCAAGACGCADAGTCGSA